MTTIGKNSFFILDLNEYYKPNISKIKNITNILNKDKLVIISGQRHIGKINFIKSFLNTLNLDNKYFYFNKSADIYSKIKTAQDLNNLLNDYVELYKKPQIIILENIGDIKSVQSFISNIFIKNYKIIIISNILKIKGKKEIEILNNINSGEALKNSIKYGNTSELSFLNNINIKEKYLHLIKNDILLYDIFKEKSIKNINLYNCTLLFLSKNNSALSLRELHKNLNISQSISLKTTIDYIDFALQAKIIKKAYRYDIKNKKTITSKAKYYFTDNGIRNSFSHFLLDSDLLEENYIFNILEYYNFDIYGGINGKFEFTFYGIKEKKQIYIHISKQTKKDGLKKEINKLLKIGNNYKKYLLVKNIKELGIKKLVFDSVEVIETIDFIKKVTK